MSSSMKRSMLALVACLLFGRVAAASVRGAQLQRPGGLKASFVELRTSNHSGTKEAQGIPVPHLAPQHQNSSGEAPISSGAHALAPKELAPTKKNISSDFASAHLMATSKKELVGDVDKFLHFLGQSTSLPFEHAKFTEAFPTKADFQPSCVAHVHRLVNRVDLSYTDEQLGSVLENECWLMDKFTYVMVDTFGRKQICKKFAADLVAARDEELASGKVTGYTQFCSRYYDFQARPPTQEIKSGAAVQSMSLFLVGLIALQSVYFS